MKLKNSSDALDRLTDFFVEDILNTSDAELMAEIEAEGNDPQAIAPLFYFRFHNNPLCCEKI